ncbi:MAG TPA: aminoglycoside phosphotransferase family protein [Candidatus Binatia bacterium]|jgi:aminoglycoside phosphotransferase (APT) family kinase protein|nr:aminoglycoside phosphotransferase family protein [Candidatus Binatia bacterium]
MSSEQQEAPDWTGFFQTEVLEAVQLEGGYANDIWHVYTEAGDYIVKITKVPPRPDRHFWDGLEKLFGLNIFESITQRKELAEFLQEHTHLRVPSIYYVEREDAKVGGPHMVMQRLPGEPLDLEQGNSRESLAHSLGEHLGQLCTAAFSDWGCYPQPRYPADAWPKRLAATLAYMAYAWYDEDEQVLAPLDQFVKQARQLEPPESFSFIMPDFRMSQFLQHDRRLSALVDVESQVLGPPELDLVILEYSLPAHLLGPFEEGYQQYHPLPTVGPHRALYRYLTYLIQALGGYDYDEWMQAPTLFD